MRTQIDGIICVLIEGYVGDVQARRPVLRQPSMIELDVIHLENAAEIWALGVGGAVQKTGHGRIIPGIWIKGQSSQVDRSYY